MRSCGEGSSTGSHNIRVNLIKCENPHEKPIFKWVNTLLGNIKSALSGTYRHHHAKHAQSYLWEFEYRFNRRADLAALPTRLAYVALRTAPKPYRVITQAELAA